MYLPRSYALAGALFLSTFGIANTGALAQAQPAQRCEVVTGGVEYRAYLPDGKRYVFVGVKALTGIYPSIFVMVDKSFERSGMKPVKDDPFAAWWIDRSRPMNFSTNLVKVRFPEQGTWHALTSWISTPDQSEITQPIRGLEQDGNDFAGIGSADTNTYAFQTRIEMQGFRGDAFDVSLPTVSFDGVTVSPPLVHFERNGDAVLAKC